ncbi:hypothetical protein LTR37_004396 [Vermiconidia calcicola]|uniref:Uncharacterized protein n=1 Tax=Vermiconidia calcicola TaxID=1690605 RepID=A0ACC3NMT1_9PEZI|nr:hypothetical protein LTR37_004396 [Vermiconidia calcicola]
MGKGARAACIAVPWLATVASLICLLLIELAGWNKGTLPSYYFMKVDFTNLDVSQASDLANTTTLTIALQQAQQSDALEDIYKIHLWNYCEESSDDSNGDTLAYCSDRKAGFVFNLVDIWHLNETTAAGTPHRPSEIENPVAAAAGRLQDNAEVLEQELLGDSGKNAYEAYKKVARAMFALYAISFWTTVATIVLAVFAIFSRLGSFLTWIVSLASSVITLAAVATSTALYIALTVSLRGIFDPYNVHVQLGRNAMTVSWLSVVFSWFATLFWLFSVCCCSGRSNPHHRSNKGGLWTAEPKGQGYGDFGGRGRGIPVAKTGGGYERVASPYLGHAENERGDRVPLTDYPQQTGRSGAYEPYRNT